MKKSLLFLLCISLFGLVSWPAQAASGMAPVTVEITSTPQALSKQELKEQRRLEKRMERKAKWASRLSKFAPKALDRYLRLAIIAAIGAVVLSVVGAIIVFVPGVGGLLATLLWLLASLAWLAALVFFVLWLIEFAG